MSARSLVLFPSWRLSAGRAFALLAGVLFLFFFAASAPSPLLAVLQHTWGFSASMLTVAFAVYAVALLAALLVAGSLSDHVGRRPVLLMALLGQAWAMLLFFFARDIGDVVWARVVQGLATGVASGVMTAAVVEAAPTAYKRIGARVSSMAPLAGLAAGALFSGVVLEYVSHAQEWVFGGLSVVFMLAAVGVVLVPETGARRPGVWASLVPRVSVPPAARAEFIRAVPALVAVWALGGLYLALAPSLLRQVLGVDSGVVNGLAITTLSGVGAVAPMLLQRLIPARAVAIGMAAMVLGLMLFLEGLALHSVVWFFAGTALAGIGFGAGFAAVLQTLAPLAQAHQRAGLFAAVFTVSYLAFSVPAMVAGRLVAPWGLVHTVQGYAVALLVLAGVSGILQWRHSQWLVTAARP